MAIAVNEESEARHNLLTQLAPSGAENFITKVFCWLLNNTDFGNTFRDKLMETCDAAVPDVGAGCTWITQKNYRLDGTWKRPDMVCESADGNTALIFEHKVEADLQYDQLKNYRRIGEENFEKSGLILITKNRNQSSQEPNRCLLWSKVHEWLETAIDGTEDADALIARNFLELLEERGLGPMKKITVEQLKAFPLALELARVARVGEQRIKRLITRVAEDSTLLDLIQDESAKTDLDKLGPHFRWGRFGLYILGDREGGWNPGVFVGVVQYDRKYGNGMLSVNDQPGACLAVYVDGKWHGQYETSEEYSKLVGALASVVPDGWKLLKPELNSKPWNPVHPLTIYKPLKTVFGNAETGDEQVDRFVKEVHRVTKAVLELEEFRQFQELFRELLRQRP